MAEQGRPSIYGQELADSICARIASGESLRTICKDERMPAMSTIMRWLLDEEKQDFWEQYAHARVVQAQLMFDELIEIADDGHNDFMLRTFGDDEFYIENKEVTNRSRLRVDTRKWYLSKVLPKIYGDKLDLTSDGKVLPTPIYGGLSAPSDASTTNPTENV